MANTIRASKNTFNGGLVMDLAPDTTPNEVLTSALNATLVTFNGNEMLLQNDMGNGRVETARLPEGYIPVGTCEFGDIIYIVSYNPLTNKSLIGCFPSPERNISSEEVGSLGQTLSASDFLEGSMQGELFVPNGELKASSVKKIIYDKKLNPGDKFIIYDKNNLILSERYITDIGNISNIYGKLPRWLRIHVISIDDEGRITYLDSSLKWYHIHDNQLGDKDYFIRTSKPKTGSPSDTEADIDSYRNLLESGYSVYQSKISGKLALLIELEKITGFSCTYSITKLDIEEPVTGSEESSSSILTYFRKYSIQMNFSWDTDDPNINPSCVSLTKSEWVGKETGKAGQIGMLDTNGKFILTGGNNDGTPNLPPQLDFVITGGYYAGTINGTLDTEFTINAYDWYNYIEHNYDTIITKFKENFKNYISGIYNTQTHTTLPDAIETSIVPTKVIINKETIPNSNEGKIPSYYINIDRTTYSNNTLEYWTAINGKYIKVDPKNINDVIINNYFNYPVYKEFIPFSHPYKLVLNNQTYLTDNSNLIYHYEFTPGMPYGLLREFSVDGYIDFSKIGSGEFGLNTWKYFNGENVSTLTIGMDAYIEDNMGVQEVVLEFYDNQGMAAAYHILKESYSGQFTEVFPLNGSYNSYKLNAINSSGETLLHAGKPATSDDTNIVRYSNDTISPAKWSDTDNDELRVNDCGILYSNMLYLVKIVVKYCPIDSLGNFNTADSSNYKYFYRWMWTNTIFNTYYQTIRDFDTLPVNITLDANVSYELTDNYYYDKFLYESPLDKGLEKSDDIYKYLSANVLVITDSENIETLPLNGSGGSSGGSETGGGEINSGGTILLTVTNQVKTMIITGSNLLPVTNIDPNKITIQCYTSGLFRPILRYGATSSGWKYTILGNSIIITITDDVNAREIYYTIKGNAITFSDGTTNLEISGSYAV